jgi:arginine/lysine/ornithine decarboxylase
MLLQDYGLQMEMASGNYVLAMTSIMDTEEGFERLAQALLAIDGTLSATDCAAEGADAFSFSEIYEPKEQVCSIAEAVDAGQTPVESEADRTGRMPGTQAVGHTTVPLDTAAGSVAADYLYLYPPGVPLIAPGERITEKTIRDIRTCRDTGFTVHGLTPEMRIEVVKFS